jgi:arylsulfatase A-like enzyme
MNRRNAILIVIDRLGAGYLGPYGNTWVETPAFNRLASQSLLWEYMIGTAPTLPGTYQAFANGRHALAPDNDSSNVWEQIRRVGILAALITDEPLLSRFSSTQAFEERIEHRSEDSTLAAESVDQTQLWETFAAALDWLEHPRDSFCLVLHSRGMSGPWDAPREFRERFADEEDPPVPNFVAPPSFSLGPDADPDEILGITQAYAGQVALLDVCLEMFLEGLFELQLHKDTLLLLTSPRGYPLGEHGHVGDYGDQLYEELLHVPLFVRRPDEQYAMERCHTLVEPADIYATLSEWFQVSPVSPAGHSFSLLKPFSQRGQRRRECVVSQFEHARSIRTPAWFLRRNIERATELYAKPDDRWEVNEVADRCGDISEELAGRLAEFEQLASEDRLADLTALPDHLLERTD